MSNNFISFEVSAIRFSDALLSHEGLTAVPPAADGALSVWDHLRFDEAAALADLGFEFVVVGGDDDDAALNGASFSDVLAEWREEADRPAEGLLRMASRWLPFGRARPAAEDDVARPVPFVLPGDLACGSDGDMCQGERQVLRLQCVGYPPEYFATMSAALRGEGQAACSKGSVVAGLQSVEAVACNVHISRRVTAPPSSGAPTSSSPPTWAGLYAVHAEPVLTLCFTCPPTHVFSAAVFAAHPGAEANGWAWPLSLAFRYSTVEHLEREGDGDAAGRLTSPVDLRLALNDLRGLWRQGLFESPGAVLERPAAATASATATASAAAMDPTLESVVGSFRAASLHGDGALAEEVVQAYARQQAGESRWRIAALATIVAATDPLVPPSLLTRRAVIGRYPPRFVAEMLRRTGGQDPPTATDALTALYSEYHLCAARRSLTALSATPASSVRTRKAPKRPRVTYDDAVPAVAVPATMDVPDAVESPAPLPPPVRGGPPVCVEDPPRGRSASDAFASCSSGGSPPPPCTAAQPPTQQMTTQILSRERISPAPPPSQSLPSRPPAPSQPQPQAQRPSPSPRQLTAAHSSPRLAAVPSPQQPSTHSSPVAPSHISVPPAHEEELSQGPEPTRLAPQRGPVAAQVPSPPPFLGKDPPPQPLSRDCPQRTAEPSSCPSHSPGLQTAEPSPAQQSPHMKQVAPTPPQSTVQQRQPSPPRQRMPPSPPLFAGGSHAQAPSHPPQPQPTKPSPSPHQHTAMHMSPRLAAHHRELSERSVCVSVHMPPPPPPITMPDPSSALRQPQPSPPQPMAVPLQTFCSNRLPPPREAAKPPRTLLSHLVAVSPTAGLGVVDVVPRLRALDEVETAAAPPVQQTRALEADEEDAAPANTSPKAGPSRRLVSRVRLWLAAVRSPSAGTDSTESLVVPSDRHVSDKGHSDGASTAKSANCRVHAPRPAPESVHGPAPVPVLDDALLARVQRLPPVAAGAIWHVSVPPKPCPSLEAAAFNTTSPTGFTPARQVRRRAASEMHGSDGSGAAFGGTAAHEAATVAIGECTPASAVERYTRKRGVCGGSACAGSAKGSVWCPSPTPGRREEYLQAARPLGVVPLRVVRGEPVARHLRMSDAQLSPNRPAAPLAAANAAELDALLGLGSATFSRPNVVRAPVPAAARREDPFALDRRMGSAVAAYGCRGAVVPPALVPAEPPAAPSPLSFPLEQRRFQRPVIELPPPLLRQPKRTLTPPPRERSPPCSAACDVPPLPSPPSPPTPAAEPQPKVQGPPKTAVKRARFADPVEESRSPPSGPLKGSYGPRCEEPKTAAGTTNLRETLEQRFGAFLDEQRQRRATIEREKSRLSLDIHDGACEPTTNRPPSSSDIIVWRGARHEPLRCAGGGSSASCPHSCCQRLLAMQSSPPCTGPTVGAMPAPPLAPQTCYMPYSQQSYAPSYAPPQPVMPPPMMGPWSGPPAGLGGWPFPPMMHPAPWPYVPYAAYGPPPPVAMMPCRAY